MSITFSTVAETLREVVTERPDYVYDSPSEGGECTYTTPAGEPSCLIGQVIFRLDPDALKEINREEWNDQEEFVTSPTVCGLDWAYDQLSDQERNVLRAAQVVQDQGGTWGEALNAFEFEARYIR